MFRTKCNNNRGLHVKERKYENVIMKTYLNILIMAIIIDAVGLPVSSMAQQKQSETKRQVRKEKRAAVKAAKQEARANKKVILEQRLVCF